jgi:signal peptidase II
MPFLKARTVSFRFIGISLLLIFSDQMSKFLIRRYGGFYTCNENIAFGIRLPDYIIWVFWSLIIIFCVLLIAKGDFNWNTPWTTLIFSGAIGNAIDRISLGCVTDFIRLPLWPAFNLADLFITFGAFWLLAKYLKS